MVKLLLLLFPAGMYIFQLNNKNTRKRCEMCPKSTQKDNRMAWFDMRTKLVDIVLVSFFLARNIFTSCSAVSYVTFKLERFGATILFLWTQSKLVLKEQVSVKSKIKFSYVCLLWFLLSQFSTLLCVIFSPPSFVQQLKQLNPLCWAHPCLIFFRDNWCQNIEGKQYELAHCKLNDVNEHPQ